MSESATRGYKRQPEGWDKFRPSAWKLGTTVGFLLVSALIGGWIANTYAQRQRELELEASLITTISRSAVQLYDSMRDVARFHGTAARRYAMRERALSKWVVASSEVDPVVFVYFDGQPTETRWNAYQDALYNYGRLACCPAENHPTAETQRGAEVRIVRAYVTRYGPFDRMPEDWDRDQIVRGPSRAHPTYFPSAYDSVGQHLMRGRDSLGREIQRGEADLGSSLPILGAIH